MKVRIGEDFTRNLVQVWVYEQFADELRVGHVWKSGPSLQFDLFPPNVMVEPTYQIPHDVWDAIVREVVVQHAGKMPADVLLKERLEIETARVDKLLEAVIE